MTIYTGTVRVLSSGQKVVTIPKNMPVKAGDTVIIKKAEIKEAD